MTALPSRVYYLLEWLSERLTIAAYADIISLAELGGLSADELRNAIEEAGEAPTRMGTGWEALLTVVDVQNAAYPTWSIWMPLWTVESGRSDFNLELTITLHPNRIAFSVDSVRVP